MNIGARSFKDDDGGLFVVLKGKAKMLLIPLALYDRPGNVIIHPHDDLIKTHLVALVDAAVQQLAFQM